MTAADDAPAGLAITAPRQPLGDGEGRAARRAALFLRRKGRVLP
jgi:hypothetical protein